MTFTPNIPVSGQSLGFTRTLVNGNFTNYFNTISVNHVAPNLSGEGKHKFLQMPVQVAAPATAASEGGVYVKTATNGSQLFYRHDNNAAEYQVTRAYDTYSATFGTQPTGWTFLPGNCLMLWGVTAASSSTTYVINFAALGLPDFANTNYRILVTGLRAASSPGNTDGYVATGYATTGFTIYNNGGHNFAYQWLAIGQ